MVIIRLNRPYPNVIMFKQFTAYCVHNLFQNVSLQIVQYRYLACQVAVCGCRSRCSLHVPPHRLSTVGRRSFPVAASIFWNTLPDDVQSAPFVSSAWSVSQTPILFHQSFLYNVLVDFATVQAVLAMLRILDWH